MEIILQQHEDSSYNCIISVRNGVKGLMQEVPFEDDLKKTIINLLKIFKVKKFNLIIVGNKKTGSQEFTPSTFSNIKELNYKQIVKQLEL